MIILLQIIYMHGPATVMKINMKVRMHQLLTIRGSLSRSVLPYLLEVSEATCI